MSTRLYLPSAGVAFVGPAIAAGWDVDQHGVYPLLTTPSATALVTTTVSGSSNPQGKYCFGQYQYQLGAQTISGTITGQFRGSAGANPSCHGKIVLAARVVSADGTIVRGTLLAPTSTGTNFATSLTNRTATALTVTPVVCVDGDILIVEVGASVSDINWLTDSFTMAYAGDPATSDLPVDNTTTTALRPWIEFSQTLVPQPPIMTVSAAGPTVSQGKTSSFFGLGSLTNWVNGVSVASVSGTGITVLSTVVSDPHNVVITVSALATALPLGLRDVTMTTGAEVTTCVGALRLTVGKSLMFAQAQKARSGATRACYTSPKVFIAVNGVQYGAAPAVASQRVDGPTLRIQDALHDTPNTASMQVKGFEVLEGSDVVMTLGSINNRDRLFAGTAINRTHGYIGTPQNINVGVNLIDYTWGLTRRILSGSWTSTSGSVIAAWIVARVPGYTGNGIAADLPVLDSFSFTDVSALSALTQLAQRCGGYCDVDYWHDVKVFLADATVTNPITLMAGHPTLEAFQFSPDLSQVITRAFVEGGGVNALTTIGLGETIIPVATAAWYSASGGLVKSGPQHLAYTGVDVGGGGGLIGPGIGPSAPPTLALAVGAGVEVGVHQYAVVFGTAAGKSKPSPLASITTVGATTLADPSVHASVGDFAGDTGNYSGTPVSLGGGAYDYNAGSGTHGPRIGDAVEYAYSWSTSATDDLVHDTNLSPASAGSGGFSDSRGTVGAAANGVPSGWVVPNGINVLYQIPAGTMSGTVHSSGCTFIHVWKKLNGGAWVRQATVTIFNAFYNGPVFYDAQSSILGGSVPAANAAIPAKQQVDIANVPIGGATVTYREIHRTIAGGTQLKLQQTIANNTATTGVRDATADGSLGANAPTSDTSGLAQPSGKVLPGDVTMPVAGGAYNTGGGWVSAGEQIIRYTGYSGGVLTGIPLTGVGAIVAAIDWSTTATALPALLGVPPSGAGSVQFPLLPGDQVNILVQVDDIAAQAALKALLDPMNLNPLEDGVVEVHIPNGTIGLQEANALGLATLARQSRVIITITYRSRDKNSRAGRTVSVNFGPPTNLVGLFQIQTVTIDTFSGLMPTFHVTASSSRFSLENLLRLVARAA